MRFLYAFEIKKDKEVPIYRDGPFWAVWGYKLFTTIANFMWDISHWFLRETCEHETITSNTQDGIIKCTSCGMKLDKLLKK